MWSGMETVTASIDLSISESSLRQSRYFLALGYFWAFLFSVFSSTSQRATTSMPASPTWLESLSPLPPQPIQATRILSLAPWAWALTMWGKAMVPAARAPARSRSRRELPDLDLPLTAGLGDSEDIVPPEGRVGA